ncbi:MAG: PAS domain-containing protein [Pontiellaceae bacterium]|nr:PAS domain-containing protein [Pontiellaceae bacterium]MBN2785040.1 PAS domain-containing protein [Pontiellaceae bacterium]
MNMNVQNCIFHFPVPLITLSDRLDLTGASRMAFSLFRVRYRAEDGEKNLKALSDVLLNDPSFVYAIGEASFKLTRIGSHIKLRWKSADRIYDISISAMPHPDGLQYGLSFDDVTKQLDIEHNREVTRNYLEQIIDSLPLGIVVTDCEMRVTAINRAQQEIMTAQGQDMSLLSAVGSLLSDLLPQHEAMPWPLVASRLFEQRKAIHRMEHSWTDNGKTRTYSSSILPLQRESGDLIGAMHITEDITEKMRLMADAREADMLAARLETLQHTVVTLNHVINNKLMSLMCNIEVARTTGEQLSPSKLRMLEEAQDEAEGIAQFIRDLADIKEIKITDYLKGGQKMLDVYGEDGQFG